MSNVFKMIVNGGIPAFVIMTLGVCALAIIVERIKVLYFDYSIKTDEFMKQVKSLVLSDQVDEAVTFCAANEKAPLAHVVKGVLERADRDDEAINQGLDIALSEIIPNLGKRLGYLSMIANVATLMGLLGTVSGLIMSFESLAGADPAKKSELLAAGISMAMSTTAIGLSVAIPVMVVYAFLHSKQNAILETVSEHSGKVVDLLTSRHYQPFSEQSAFPKDLESSALMKDQPPAPSVKSA